MAGMDVSVDRDFDGDGVRCVFRMDGKSKRTTRVFRDMQSALNIAVFIAGQNGITKKEQLRAWLELRGFEVESIEVAADREEAAARLAASGPFTVTNGPLPLTEEEPRVRELQEEESGSEAK